MKPNAGPLAGTRCQGWASLVLPGLAGMPPLSLSARQAGPGGAEVTLCVQSAGCSIVQGRQHSEVELESASKAITLS